MSDYCDCGWPLLADGTCSDAECPLGWPAAEEPAYTHADVVKLVEFCRRISPGLGILHEDEMNALLIPFKDVTE